MVIDTLRRLVNTKLAGELLALRELIPFMDMVIDDINQQLNSVYPVFSELAEGTTEYQYFPDRYLRTVVANGAAFYYYQADEEGVNNSSGYETEYRRNLFYMVRDYMHAVPEEYKDNPENGTIEHENNGAFDDTGIHDGNFGDWF